jgi:citrate synthase
MPGELLSAREAAGLLGVKLTTLYAYVSRGLVRSRPLGEGRERSYLRSDLARLKARRRAKGTAPLSGALHWGEPVLESSITEITERGPVYRGQPAAALAGSGVPFESVAELLWTRRLPDRPPRWTCPTLGVAPSRLSVLVPKNSSPLSAMALLLTAVGAGDPGRFETAPASVLARTRPLVRRMAATLAIAHGAARVEAALRAPSVAAAIAIVALGTAASDVVAAIDRALVLVADHELNVSAFAARVAASAGADVYGSLSAALAALAGPKHGGFVERVEALLDEIGEAGRASRVVHERARRGEHVPGFGHPIYHPLGDPRAAPLLDAARRLAPRKPRVRTVFALIEAMREEGRPPPTIDLGLVAIGAALGLPRAFGIALFAIGRTAGWVAHILEQYEADFLIRPRALYRKPG